MARFLLNGKIVSALMVGLWFVTCGVALANSVEEFLPPVPLDHEFTGAVQEVNTQQPMGDDSIFDEDLGPVPLVRKVLELLQQYLPLANTGRSSVTTNA